eukprot:5213324-Pyramimonas_sp.AAC.1
MTGCTMIERRRQAHCRCHSRGARQRTNGNAMQCSPTVASSCRRTSARQTFVARGPGNSQGHSRVEE